MVPSTITKAILFPDTLRVTKYQIHNNALIKTSPPTAYCPLNTKRLSLKFQKWKLIYAQIAVIKEKMKNERFRREVQFLDNTVSPKKKFAMQANIVKYLNKKIMY